MARQDAFLRLHKTLIARRTELRKRLGVDLEDLAHVKHSSASGDAADAAFDASGEEIASTLAELESKELAQIERALRRLKAGSYGKCEVCSLTIPVARLNALPYSTLCVKCQREMEARVAGCTVVQAKIGVASPRAATQWKSVTCESPISRST